jgi:hypothetical protein
MYTLFFVSYAVVALLYNTHTCSHPHAIIMASTPVRVSYKSEKTEKTFVPTPHHDAVKTKEIETTGAVHAHKTKRMAEPSSAAVVDEST